MQRGDAETKKISCHIFAFWPICEKKASKYFSTLTFIAIFTKKENTYGVAGISVLLSG